MRRRAVPRQVESRLPGRPGPGPARRRRLSHCSKGHRRRRLREAAGRARVGGRVGGRPLPRPTRDLGLGAPRIYTCGLQVKERLRGGVAASRSFRGNGGAETGGPPHPAQFGGSGLGLGRAGR